MLILIIIKKIIYLTIIIVVNLYACVYIANKFTARMELRRGYRMIGPGGLGYPVLRFFGYLSKGSKISIWSFFIFIFSFMIWIMVPFSSLLSPVSFENSLLVVFVFYFLLLLIYLIDSTTAGSGFILGNFTKKVMIIFSYNLPILFCISSLILVNKTANLKEIVYYQYEYWNILYQPLGFIIFLLSILFQFKVLGLNRKSEFSIFDYNEKSKKGLDSAINKMAAYVAVLFLILILCLIYLGGYQELYFIKGEILLGIKFYLVFVVILLLDRAIGRTNSYTVLTRLNLRFLLPASLVNFLITVGYFLFKDYFNSI